MDHTRALEEEIGWLRGQVEELLKREARLSALVLTMAGTLQEIFLVFEVKGPPGFSQSTKEEV